jgi:hypothetical protein
MEKGHLVILGVKANSWAWGVEQSAALSNQGIKVVALDFDLHRGLNSPRLRAQTQLLDFESTEILHARDFIDRLALKRMDSKARSWVKANANNAQWVTSSMDGLPIGRIIMSNYARIAGTRNFRLELIPKNFQRKIVSLAMLADYMYKMVGQEYQEISLSNGRSPIEAVFLTRAREKGQKVNVLERGASTTQWFVYQTSPHFAPDWWEMMKEVEARVSTLELESVSSAYWNTRLKGWDELSGRDWSREFETGKIPPQITSRSVMFFCTSQHEVPVISEFECSDRGYPSQQIAVRELVNLCQELGKTLVIKRHPNSVAIDGVDREAADWEWIAREKNVIYIDPLSKVDTYALLEMAESVVSFKSSVGVEASALGIPARSMGPAEWAYKIETRVWERESLKNFLLKPELLDRRIHQTWGYLVRTFGKELVCFQDITGGFAQTRKGEIIYSADYYDHSLSTLISRVSNKIWSIRLKYSRA